MRTHLNKIFLTSYYYRSKDLKILEYESLLKK